MTLSDTEAGGMWLENFLHEDRELARKLLDSFALDSWTQARAKLLELLRSEIDKVRSCGAVWVIPAMDSGDIRKANDLAGNESLIAFNNFQPGMDIPSMPGSEGIIGHLLRDVQGNGVLPSTAPLAELRRKRVSTILVVTDTIETGGQVAKYVQALLRNPTLKSWKSFGWIKVGIVAYAVSDEGEKLLSGSLTADFVRFVRSAPTVRALPWASPEVENAISLCRRYGQGSNPLGYGDQASLFGFQDRVPNTVPKIFRQRGKSWIPLFEGRSGRLVPTGMISELLGSSNGPVAHDDLLAAVRQERLSISINKQQRASNRHILTALALLKASPERATLLGVALDLTQTEVTSLLNYLLSQGLIAGDNSLTPAGTAELIAGKRKPRRVMRKSFPTGLSPYYPESLR